MNQLEFELKPFNGVFQDLQPRVVDAFLSYHEQNPHVFQLFKRFAHEIRESGKTRYSSAAILERLRWEIEIERKGEFKINNSHSACYSRLLIFIDPSFADFFETRKTPGQIVLDSSS